MRLIQPFPHSFWQTDDVAALDLNDAGAVAPSHIRARNMQDYAGAGESRLVPVACLELLTTGWSERGAQRFGVYRNPSGKFAGGIVVIEDTGAECRAYAFDDQLTGGNLG
jgi:hypothetical protein